MLRVAAMGRRHVHADRYVREIKEHPQADVSVVRDEDPERGADWAASLDLPFDGDVDAVLQRDDVDAVRVTTPTSLRDRGLASEAGCNLLPARTLAGLAGAEPRWPDFRNSTLVSPDFGGLPARTGHARDCFS